MKFRKKPVVIEARRLNEANLEEVATWCRGSIKGVNLPRHERVIDIQTLEGEMRAQMGDWIIRGVKGEFYPCKSDIFDVSYEPAADEPDPYEQIANLAKANAEVGILNVEIQARVGELEQALRQADTVNGELIRKLKAEEAANRDLLSKNMALVSRAEAAEQFKAYVHGRLDAAGIPTHPNGPHSKDGCRIGDRLDLIFSAFNAANAYVAGVKARAALASRPPSDAAPCPVCAPGPCDPAAHGFPRGYEDASLAKPDAPKRPDREVVERWVRTTGEPEAPEAKCEPYSLRGEELCATHGQRSACPRAAKPDAPEAKTGVVFCGDPQHTCATPFECARRAAKKEGETP